MMIKQVLWLGIFGLFLGNFAEAAYVSTPPEGIRYRAESEYKDDPVKQDRCRLWLSTPKGGKGFPTIVWFHAGGFVGGEKAHGIRTHTGWKSLRADDQLCRLHFHKTQKIALAPTLYRLTPTASVQDALDDGAAAVAWIIKNIANYGGDPKKVFIAGHSAGAYLTLMLALDKQYLGKYGVDPDRDILGVIPISGHTITHLTIRYKRGGRGERAEVDEFAPLYHARKDAVPMLLITGGRNQEFLGRYEENAFFWRMMKLNKHSDVTLLEMDGYGHDCVYPATIPALKFLHRLCYPKKK